MNSTEDYEFKSLLTPPENYFGESQHKPIFDGWINKIGNVNCNNAIMQYSQYFMNRIPYSYLAQLSTDTIINKAINTLSKDIIGNKGTFVITEELSNSGNIILELENELNEMDFWVTLKKGIENALIYGGCLLYLDNSHRPDQNIPYRFESYQGVHKLKRIQVVEPIYIAPASVETTNPLSSYYMRPQSWRVNSLILNNSQIIPIIIYDIPSLYKPLYNYLGISYIQFMYPFVRNCESIRESLADMFLRFRTTVIKTTDSLDEKKISERIKYHNKVANNHSVLMLSEHEDFVQTITSITGMEGILNQAYQSLAIAARMPAVKLLGLSPQGLNNTGEFDMKNYYDEVESYQKSIFEFIVTKVAQNLLWGMGYNYSIKFEFTPISQESYTERIQRHNITVDLIDKILTNGLISDEQAFEILKKEGIIDDSMAYEESEEEPEPDIPSDADENDIENDNTIEKNEKK